MLHVGGWIAKGIRRRCLRVCVYYTHAQCKAVSNQWCQHVLLGIQGNIQNKMVKMNTLHMASGDDATCTPRTDCCLKYD